MSNKRIRKTDAIEDGVHKHNAEDQVVSFFEQRIRPHWRQGLWAVLVLILGLMIGFRYVQGRQQSMAMAYSRLDLAESVEELRLLSVEYAGREIAAMALLRKANMLLEDADKQAEAAAVFTRVANDFPQSRFHDSARLGLAYSLESTEDFKGALDTFRQLATSGQADTNLAANAWCGVGRNALALGDAEEARKAFERALAMTDRGPYANQARQFLDDI